MISKISCRNFRPEHFFVGKLEGWAIESLTGNLLRRARIVAEGRSGNGGRSVSFNETYTFDDGQVDTLAWTIRHIADGLYRGTEATLVGEAEGEQAGGAFNWCYTRNTPPKDGSALRF